MYFKFKCPHCEKSLKVREELAGRKCACPYCKGSVRIPESAPQETPESETPAPGFPGIDVNAAPKIKGGKSPAASLKTAPRGTPPPRSKKPAAQSLSGYVADTSDIPILQSGLIGAAATASFFVLTFPIHTIGIMPLFWDRGWVPYVLVWLSCWSFSILYLKWKKLKRQRQAMILDVLPTELSREITLESLDRFEEYIHGLPSVAGESFLINRVIRGLEHFRVRKSAAETVTMMESQSDIDANNVSSSYTIVKVFIWALPIMGFIGTVMGVSSAVGSLAGSLESASDISAVKESLKDVFGGLGVAFDTTLLALVLSLFVKIPTSGIQKAEEDLVTWVDEYCNENLLKRLNDGREGGAERGATSEKDAKLFREAVQSAMAAHQSELESWFQRLEKIGSTMTTQVADGWESINAKMLQSHAKALAQSQQDLQQQAGQVKLEHEERAAELRKQQEEQIVQLQQQQQQWLDSMQELANSANEIQQSLKNLDQHAESVQQQMADSINGTSQSVQSHFSGLERGLTGLSAVLEKLGEQQVVVQQVEKPRRGWFGGGKSRRR